MIKFIHAADFHLDSAFGGLPVEKSRERRRESRELVDRLADLALLEKADLVLLSGDLFDGERVYPETLERLKTALARMRCPVFIAPGNHDPYTPRSPYAHQPWPDNVCVFREEGLSSVALPELKCVVHGAAFTGPERTSPALAPRAVPADGMTHLFCLHGDVGSPSSRYGPITREQIARSKADYVALGHVHQYSGPQRDGDTCWAYPGCPEGRGFDELGDKGVLVGRVASGGTKLRFVPLCKRRYWILEADVTDTSPREALESVMPDTAGQDVCRVLFTGEADGQGVELDMVASMFEDRFYALELRDRTRPAQSLWEKAGENSLRGLFLQEMKIKYDAAKDDAAREQVTMAVRFGLAALEGRDIG
ncbi:MAG: DNA repair exonuclease [Oscillospiraceae bacterium]|jgi:exonuclease SbcD|nr:DNA repair exonuclease [Oscillospiraceae bacterium]